MKGIGLEQAQRLAMRQAKGLGLKGTKARPHMLILAAKLRPDTDNYSLSLEHSIQKNILGFAEGLRDRNGFLAVAHALGIAKVPVRGGVEYPEAAQIVFHPDANLFPTAATATLSEAEQLRSIHLGRHSIVTNEDIRIDRNPNYALLTRQTTQGSASTENEQDGAQFKMIGATVRFAGGDQNSIDFHLPCQDKSLIAGSITAGDGHANYLVYFLPGAILKGGTTKLYTQK